MAMQVVRDDLWLCDDCTIVAVNDDASGIESDERISAVDEGLAALGPHLVPDHDAETGDGVREFSNVRCDSCNTPLAGRRYRFAVLGPR